MAKKKIFSKFIGLGLLGAALLLWLGSQNPEAAAVKTVDRTLTVNVGTVEQKKLNRRVRFSGVTRAADRAILSFSIPARLVSRSVESGDLVHKGQVLAQLDHRQFENMVATAQASVDQIKAKIAQADLDYNRIKKLVDANAAAKEKFERITTEKRALGAGLDAALTNLEEARRQLGETRIKAPFDGIVTSVFLQPGEWAAPGRPVIEISGIGHNEIRVEVPEAVMVKLEENQPVRVEFPFADNLEIYGHIHTIARAASGPGSLFPVIVGLSNTPEVAAGMTAEVVFTYKSSQVLTVPLEAVINPGSSRPSVFSVIENKIKRVDIDLGEIVGQRIVVKGGLKAGDKVVVSGQTKLSDGDWVEVRI